jgi:hypothetical protein
MILSAEEEKGGGKRTIPTVRNLQRKSRIVRVFLGSSWIWHEHKISGVTHAWVGQQLVKRNILRVFTVSKSCNQEAKSS